MLHFILKKKLNFYKQYNNIDSMNKFHFCELFVEKLVEDKNKK